MGNAPRLSLLKHSLVQLPLSPTLQSCPSICPRDTQKVFSRSPRAQIHSYTVWGRVTARQIMPQYGFGSGSPLRPCNGAEPDKAQRKQKDAAW